MTLSRSIARTLRRLGESLTPEDRAGSCLRIADSIGIGIGATASGDTATHVIAGAIDGSNGGACSVLGQPRREAPATAAFANSALVHVLDFDDIHDAARLHPTTVTLPAALAAAQLVKADGRRVADAVLLGDELICRLGVACSPKGTGPGSDWFLTQLFGYFGAAYAAGSVLGLDEDALVSAFGLAYMQAAGGKQAGFGVGSNARAIYPAFASQGGVQAALLARAGMQGPDGAFDGAAGLFPVYLGAQPTPAQRDLLLGDSQWEAPIIELKPWPCCRRSHPYVATALAMRDAVGNDPKQIEIHVNASAAKLCRPLAERRRPVTLQDAKYSIPWMTAFTLVHGRVDLTTLSEVALADERVLAVAQHVEVLETMPDRPGHPPARIRVQQANGSWIESPPDVPVPSLDTAAAQAKFSACLAHAGRSARQAQALWNGLLSLHTQPSVDFLFEHNET